jgi:UDPglucose 6-dehydrogenase
MAKRITVIGTGYVGLVTAVGLADFGNSVRGVDINPAIVARLRSRQSTIFEHGIEDYLQRNIDAGRLDFTTDLPAAARDADIIIIAVGTPTHADGTADLSQVQSVVASLPRHESGSKLVVIKSTVPVGTNRWVSGALNPEGRTGGRFVVVSNPEFLREGRAVQDFFHPDRIVVGSEDNSARGLMEEMYRPLYLISTPFVWCNWETAELVKYASNAFLATKITFINQIANISEACNADVHVIAKTLGMDGRIGGKFLHPGPGYGGSCLPKDTREICNIGARLGERISLVEEVIRANEAQKTRVTEKLERLVGGNLAGKTVAVLGLAFKSETDDIRESPACSIIPELERKGARVKAHDPKAMETFKRFLDAEHGDGVFYAQTALEACAEADCIVILTEWNEYRTLDLPEARRLMKGAVLLDTRNLLRPIDAIAAGFTYQGTGRNGENGA